MRNYRPTRETPFDSNGVSLVGDSHRNQMLAGKGKYYYDRQERKPKVTLTFQGHVRIQTLQ